MKKIKVVDVVELPAYLKKMRVAKETVFCNISGKDSVYAIIKYYKENPDVNIFPVSFKTNTLLGEPSVYEENVTYLNEMLKIKNKQGLLVVDIGILWKELNGRHLGFLTDRFKFIPMCVGCHLLIYLTTAIMARFTGASVVIGGSRRKHGNRIKINQLDVTTQFYRRILKELLRVDLVLPLAGVINDKDLLRIRKNVNKKKWQNTCIMSGNYVFPDGKARYTESNIKQYFEIFVKPFSMGFLKHFERKYKQGLPLDINGIQKDIEKVLKTV